MNNDERAEKDGEKQVHAEADRYKLNEILFAVWDSFAQAAEPVAHLADHSLLAFVLLSFCVNPFRLLVTFSCKSISSKQ